MPSHERSAGSSSARSRAGPRGCSPGGTTAGSAPASSAVCSSSYTNAATPDFDACVIAPPSSSWVTSSPVTVFTTSGPVMNMCDVPFTMKTKSVIAGEYDRATGARAEDHADLRDHARRLHVAGEDAAVGVERDDTFLDAGAGAVVEADHRRADRLGEVHHLVDLLGEHLAERAAEHGEVLAEEEHLAAVDRAPAGDDAVGERPGVLDAEAVGAVAGEHVELDERVGVEQQVDALARGELPALVLALDRGVAIPRGAPARAARRAARAAPRSGGRGRVLVPRRP